MIEATKLGNPKFQDATARGDSIAWLHPGKSPMDTPAFASLSVAFQELRSDLHEFMKLSSNVSEYQLAYYPTNNMGYKKHRDAFPDDGSEPQQRRVTLFLHSLVERVLFKGDGDCLYESRLEIRRWW